MFKTLFSTPDLIRRESRNFSKRVLHATKIQKFEKTDVMNSEEVWSHSRRSTPKSTRRTKIPDIRLADFSVFIVSQNI